MVVWDGEGVLVKDGLIFVDGEIGGVVEEWEGLCDLVCRLVEGSE